MRFFRIPAFTGIETHRDDADRGSLRVVEGCVPHGPGGLRSGPVWEKLGQVSVPIDTDQNKIIALDDGKGNSVICAGRTDEIHDIRIASTEHTEITNLGASESVSTFEGGIFRERTATFQPVGDRLYAFGDGSAEAVLMGKGPPGFDNYVIFRNDSLYGMEWSTFPNCQYYVQGPKKTLFAAGNPNKPLRVYISEPKSLSDPYREFPYSTEETAEHAGVLSTVDILSSNATRITALSTRGDQVVVHTDKGCHLLYSPKSDQAETGFRVEQVPATNFSGAVNSQVVAGESGSQHFWMGHDGQIYKDEAASRGAEDFKGYADAAQANWKAKGTWEKEHPIDLSDAFATYDPQSGMYWVYTRSDEFTESISGDAPGYPVNLQSTLTPDEPGVPESLTSSLIPDEPGVPESLTSSLIPDEPGVPENLTSSLIPDVDAPGVPGNLTSSLIPDEPGVPENLTSSLIPDVDAPGVPTNLTSSLIPDEPGVPTNLQSSLVPDAPGVPTNLSSSLDYFVSYQNGTSIKIQVRDNPNGVLLSPTYMVYTGKRDTGDLIQQTATTYQWSANPTGTMPSWTMLYNQGGVNKHLYLVGDSSANFYVYHFNGDPVNNWVGYQTTPALSSTLFGNYFINNGNYTLDRYIDLSQ